MSTLHTHRFGPAGPAQVLAVHGLTGHGRRWRSLAEEHLADVTVVAPDLLGHGRSSWAAPWSIDACVAALAALVEEAADEPVVVAGHSLGGAIALHLAATRPELVRALVLLDPAMAIDGDRLRTVAEQTLESPDYTDRAEARADKVAGAWDEVAPALLDEELDEHLVPWPGGRWGWRLSLPAVVSYWSELARPVAVPAVAVPTTLVRASRVDPPYASDDVIAALRGGLGDALEVLTIDGDHMVPLAHPGHTASLIRRHLPLRHRPDGAVRV